MRYSFGIGNKVTCQKPLVEGNRIYTDSVETVGGLDVSPFHLFFFMCIAWYYGPTEARRGVGSPVIGVTGWL